MNKRDELEKMVLQLSPSVIAVTETWLTNDVLDAEVSIQGFTMFRCDRIARMGGGVLLYVREDYPASLITTSSDSEGVYESIWCKVKLSHSGYENIGLIYRTPGSQPPLLLADMKRFANGGHCLVLGDFNAPGIDWIRQNCIPTADPYTRELHMTICELYLFQHVQEATRSSATSCNILDLVLSPRESDVCCLQILPPLGNSDHSVVTFHWNRGMPPTQPSTKQKNVWRIPFAEMRESATALDWLIDSDDVDALWEHIRDNIDTLIDQYAPVWEARPHAKGPPWFDFQLRKRLRQRNRAWRHFRHTGEGYAYYKQIRDDCTSMKLAKRKEFEEKLAIESEASPKRLFAYFRNRTRVNNCIPTISYHNGDAENDADKATAFAEHYGSVYTQEQGSVPASTSFTTTTICEQDIAESDVANYLRLLKTHKSPGPDAIHPLVLKELTGILARPLAALFTLSLRCGKLPSQWKTAIVRPMHKSGSKKLPVNYRPVSLTCVIGKLMEKVINRRLQDHLERNDLLHPSQHGFRPRRSCMTNLLIARERWVHAKASGHDVDVVFIDFSKAFDKVPHQRLLSKLHAAGVRGDTYNWISDFLIGRSFSVNVNGASCPQRPVTSGVPQGSVLGPTLFIIFVNDLLESIRSPCLAYADDVKIWREICNDDDPDLLQEDLDRLVSWSGTWNLPINASKCTYLHIGNDARVNAFHVGGTLLPTVQTEKDLGVILSSSLKTSAHTDRVCASARGILGAIRRSFAKLTPTAFRTLFAAHVRPRLEYGGTVAYPCTLGELDQIERVQRAATRLVDGLAPLDYADRLESLNLFPQSYRRARGDLITLRHILRGDNDGELLADLQLRNDDRCRGHLLTLRKQTACKLSAKLRLSHRVVNLWNSLPAVVAEEENAYLFKQKLDAHLRGLWCRSRS